MSLADLAWLNDLVKEDQANGTNKVKELAELVDVVDKTGVDAAKVKEDFESGKAIADIHEEGVAALAEKTGFEKGIIGQYHEEGASATDIKAMSDLAKKAGFVTSEGKIEQEKVDKTLEFVTKLDRARKAEAAQAAEAARRRTPGSGSGSGSTGSAPAPVSIDSANSSLDRALEERERAIADGTPREAESRARATAERERVAQERAIAGGTPREAESRAHAAAERERVATERAEGTYGIDNHLPSSHNTRSGEPGTHYGSTSAGSSSEPESAEDKTTSISAGWWDDMNKSVADGASSIGRGLF